MQRRTVLKLLTAVTLAGTLGMRNRARAASASVTPGVHAALLVVDVQNCFIAGGSLAVPHGEDVIPVINSIAVAFRNIILTQDWHPPGHVSFASSHPGHKAFDMLALPYGQQVLWPDHCIQGTADAALASALDLPRAQLVIRKGFHPEVDSYSAFREANHTTRTGLAGYLREREIDTVFVTGLATDFCVAWTALDARAAGFTTYVVEDACRGIDLHDSVAAAWATMQAHGVRRIQSKDIVGAAAA